MHEAVDAWIYRGFNSQDDIAALVSLLKEVEQADHFKLIFKTQLDCSTDAPESQHEDFLVPCLANVTF
ncbi:MAG: hypothetical protein NVS4B9_29010 [Ktedonobacteraceae bacterium]